MSKGIKSIFATKLTDVDTTDVEGVGTIRQEGNKVYKYCNIKNTTATVAGVAGTLVSYFAATGYPTHRVVIDQSDADAVPFGAGALCGTVTGTLTVDYYGWVQIAGPCTLDTAVTSGAAGKDFVMSTTDKTGTVAAGYFEPRVGTNYNATTGVCLKCPW